MIILWLALLGASIVTALLVALVYLTARKERPTPRALLRWVAPLWVFNVALDLAVLYLAQPPLTGPYWGGQWLLWPLLLTGVIALFGGNITAVRTALDSFTEQVNHGDFASMGFGAAGGSKRATRVVDANKSRAGNVPSGRRAGGIAIALVFVVALLVNGLITVATTWFDPNVKSLAAIPHMISEPNSAQLPPTDVNHITLVSDRVAAYLGEQALAQNGQNLGSQYHANLNEYTLQSVRGHLYWIAPLVYNNVWANLGNWQSPGYIAVDAEDPNVTPQLHTGFHMRYLPDALFNQGLTRHVYLSGYTDGDLVDPTLEVNDSWQPYFTISLMQPTQGFTGEVVRRVLLVDAQSGAISSYIPSAVPSWVDRIIPSATVTDYLTWWGKYAHAPWINPSGAGQQVPALGENADKPMLVYNTVEQPVWLVPMTSSSASDSSSTGVVLFDTRDNTGRFYPIAGLGVGSTVASAFQSNPQNIRNYKVANIQLYQIYGEPTWVATFVQDNLYGQSFQGVGLVDARHLNGANVIMAANKSDALAGYAQWLADHNVQTGTISPTGKTVTTQGKVTRISAATESGTTVYYLLLNGQTRIFKAGLGLSPQLPLVQAGDMVECSYLDTGQSVVTLTAFSDLSIPPSASTPTTVGASATATP